MHTDGSRSGGGAVTVVVMTMNRRDELLRSLGHLAALPERPPVVVVDNGSTDGSPAAVRRAHPAIDVVELGTNIGAAARNVGAVRARTPYVAFSDDDSWWAPGALARAAELLDRHPRLAVIAARMLVGRDERLDPVCNAMAASPLPPEPDLPGRPVLGFVACGAVVRRDAFLATGGFDDLLFFVGEEQLLAMDLAEAGWGLAYVDDVVAHHHPSASRQPGQRRALAARNDLLAAWMRRPLGPVAAHTGRMAGRAWRDPVDRRALLAAARRLPRALRRRRVVRVAVEHRLRLLDATR